MVRRPLAAIAVLMLALHGLGMARTLVPAQDGLKFLRVARGFQERPPIEVIRGTDQHPLYPGLVALAEPPVRILVGAGPTAWRVAAQIVSTVAAIATLFPLFGLTRALFGDRPALLAALLFALLPAFGAIGHDTLSDSLALLLFVTCLRWGEVGLRTGSRGAWVLAGLASGLGYLARPEILLAGVVLGFAAVLPRSAKPGSVEQATRKPSRPRLANLAGLGVAAFAVVGLYAMAKGEVSEKLSLRVGINVGASARSSKAPPAALPRGLDDARWDFAPKEESSSFAAGLAGAWGKTSLRLGQLWAEGLGFVLLPCFVWGVLRGGRLGGSVAGRRMIALYAAMFAAVAVRHATSLGYLSGRHALTLVVASLPWVGAGIWSWASRFPSRRNLDPIAARRLGTLGLACLIAVGVTAQVRASHPSRWGHWAAGRWLADHAAASDAVLDTRGWANFVRGGPGYDYWHVRQALADPALGFVVVGADEMDAETPRGATLRAVLAHAGVLAAEFSEREGGPGIGVRVYRFHAPTTWEGLRP